MQNFSSAFEKSILLHEVMIYLEKDHRLPVCLGIKRLQVTMTNIAIISATELA